MLALNASLPEPLGQLHYDPVVTVALDGEIGQGELAEIWEMLSRIGRRGPRKVVLDLTDVEHFDYRGVRPLMARAKEFRERGGDVKLCGLSAYLRAIFRSVSAQDGFEFFSDALKAHEAFAGWPAAR